MNLKDDDLVSAVALVVEPGDEPAVTGEIEDAPAGESTETEAPQTDSD